MTVVDVRKSVRRSCALASSAGAMIVALGVNVPFAIVPTHMPTASTALPASRVPPGMKVSTVNDQLPAANPLTPPAGSTTKPAPSGSVGSETRRVLFAVPGAKV